MSGWQKPSDMASDWNMHAFAIFQEIRRIRTMTVVQVKAVTNAGGVVAAGTVDVLPLVSMVDSLGNVTPHGIVTGLPYFRLQNGANAIICDPKVGDIGMAIIADRDTSTVRKTKKQAAPGSGRMFNFSDGIYIGGILNGPPTTYIKIDNNVIEMSPDGGTTLVRITPNLVFMQVTELRVTGDITSGYGTTDQIGMRTHVHSQPPDSRGDTEANTNAPKAGT